MSLAERLFDAVTRFPDWLSSFDSLKISPWSVMLIMAIASIGLIYAVREFLSWFLKTNAIVDEVTRLETLVRDVQGDLAALESTVARLQSTATATALSTTAPPLTTSDKEKRPQFLLNN